MPPKTHYAVSRGLQTGIFTSWNQVKPLVSGVGSAEYKGFTSLKEAETWLEGKTVAKLLSSVAVGVSQASVIPAVPAVPVARPPRPKLQIQPSRLPVKPNPNLNLSTVSVDGGHNRMTGIEGWGCVVDHDGKDLIAPYADLCSDLVLRDVVLPVGARYVVVAKFNDVKTQQTNGSEILALLVGLRIAIATKQVKIIQSDSTVALSWSQYLGKDRIQVMDPAKVKVIKEVIELRRQFEAQGGKLVKISGDDNLSDIGFHRKK